MNKLINVITPVQWWPPPIPSAVVDILPEFVRRHLKTYTFSVHDKLPGQTQKDLDMLRLQGMSMRVVNILYNAYIQLLVSEKVHVDGVLRYSSFCVGLEFTDSLLIRRLFNFGDRRRVDELHFADFALLCWKVCACPPHDLNKLAFQLFNSERQENQLYVDDARLMIIALVGKESVTRKGYMQRLTKDLIHNHQVAVPFAAVMRFLDVHQTLLRPIWVMQGQLQQCVGHRRLWKAQAVVRTRTEEAAATKARRRLSTDSVGGNESVVGENDFEHEQEVIYGLSGGGGKLTKTVVSPFPTADEKRRGRSKARRSSAPDIGIKEDLDDGTIDRAKDKREALLDELKGLDGWLREHDLVHEQDADALNHKKPLSALPGRARRHRPNRLAPMRNRRRASTSVAPSATSAAFTGRERRLSLEQSRALGDPQNESGAGLPPSAQRVRRFSAPDGSVTAVALVRRQKMKAELAERRKRRRSSLGN
jgi:hypothetical protein